MGVEWLYTRRREVLSWNRDVVEETASALYALLFSLLTRTYIKTRLGPCLQLSVAPANV